MREAVGIWDESPLRKWFFTGKDALAAVDYCFTSDMAGLEAGQCRYGAFCDEHGKMLGDGVAFRGKDAKHTMVVTALDTDGDHFRRICKKFTVEIEDATMRPPAPAGAGPEVARAARGLHRCRRREPALLPVHPRPGDDLRRRRLLAGAYRLLGRAGYEVYVPLAGAERVWQGLLDQGAAIGVRPYGLAAVESLRIEAGLIFLATTTSRASPRPSTSTSIA